MRRESNHKRLLHGRRKGRVRHPPPPKSRPGHPESDTAAFLAAIVESSNDAIVTKDLNGIITSWNQGAERIFGYKPHEAVGRPITILIPPEHIHEEGYILDRIRRGERVGHFETVRRRKDGSDVEISLTVSPIRDAEGTIIGASKIARDITIRRRALEQLQQSEERFRVTLFSIGDGVIATDKEGRVRFMNAVAEKLTGWNAKEAEGLPLEGIFRIINEITRQPVENPVARVIEKGCTVGLGNHTLLIAKDGRERCIDDSAAPIRRENGELTGVVLVFRDATDQRAAQVTARKLKALVESSEDAIYSTDLDGVITGWNPGAESMFGYKQAEALGRTVAALIIPPDRADKEARMIERIRHGERVEHYETVRLHRDGSPVEVSIMVAALKDTPTDRLVGVWKIARDITKHKRAEEAALETAERYRNLFNSMDEGFCVIEMIFDQSKQPVDYRFLETNPAFEKQTGIKDGLGKRMREIAPRHEQHWFEIYGKVALTGEPVRFQNQAEALNRWFDVYAYRVGRPDDRKVAILFTDITERRKAEKALARAKEELEQYARNLETLVSERTAKLQQTVADLEAFSFTVSHDLRSPLRSMEGFAQALLTEYSDKLDTHGREYLERISKSAVRLDKLILEVLTYSRIGRDEMAIAAVNLDKLFEEVMQIYPAIRAFGAEITIEHPLHNVRGAQSLLIQCISNVLTNAVKFVHPGSKPKVRVWSEKGDSTVRLFVEDNGIGIPQNLRAKVFEPFQTAHPQAGYPGTGMGLAIVRKATDRMNGSVGVESRDGHGSRFWLELPAA